MRKNSQNELLGSILHTNIPAKHKLLINEQYAPNLNPLFMNTYNRKQLAAAWYKYPQHAGIAHRSHN
jgi:hypothetical protein